MGRKVRRPRRGKGKVRVRRTFETLRCLTHAESISTQFLLSTSTLASLASSREAELSGERERARMRVSLPAKMDERVCTAVRPVLPVAPTTRMVVLMMRWKATKRKEGNLK